MNDKSAIPGAIGASNGSSKTLLNRLGEGSDLPFALLYPMSAVGRVFRRGRANQCPQISYMTTHNFVLRLISLVFLGLNCPMRDQLWS